MTSSPSFSFLAASGAATLLLALGIGWKMSNRPVAVPSRKPLPSTLKLTDGKRTWKIQARKAGLDPVRRRLDLAKASRALKAIANGANTPGKDAELLFTEDGPVPTLSELKRTVKLEESLRRLMAYASSAYPPAVIPLAMEKRPPRVETEDLEEVKERVAEFVTRYNPGDRSRTRNVQLVAERLDGALVLPGEVFSFNGWVGPRDESAGFKSAYIFQNGRMVIDTGGGTCQVSTTLYNAALLAGTKIVERRNHSFTVPYVRPGRDAMVYYGQSDLKFKNVSDAPLYIRASAHRGRLRIEMYGQKAPGPAIEITSWSRRKGDRVYAGASRLYKEDGKVVKTEKLSSDVYTPLELAEKEL